MKSKYFIAFGWVSSIVNLVVGLLILVYSIDYQINTYIDFPIHILGYAISVPILVVAVCCFVLLRSVPNSLWMKISVVVNSLLALSILLSIFYYLFIMVS